MHNTSAYFNIIHLFFLFVKHFQRCMPLCIFTNFSALHTGLLTLKSKIDSFNEKFTYPAQKSGRKSPCRFQSVDKAVIFENAYPKGLGGTCLLRRQGKPPKTGRGQPLSFHFVLHVSQKTKFCDKQKAAGKTCRFLIFGFISCPEPQNL